MDFIKLKESVEDMVSKLPKEEKIFFKKCLTEIKKAVKSGDSEALLSINKKTKEFVNKKQDASRA